MMMDKPTTPEIADFSHAWGVFLLVLSDLGMTKKTLKAQSKKLPAIWDYLVETKQIRK